jgi:hypothetical protein
MSASQTVHLRAARLLRTAALGLLVLGALGLAGKALVDPPRAKTAADSRSTVEGATGPVTVLFIGGWVTEGGKASVATAASSAAWRAIVRDHPGAALLCGGSDGSAPLTQQVEKDASGASPSALVVSAGACDASRPPSDAVLAAEHMIDLLRATVSRSTALVLLGPPVPGFGVDLAADSALRDALAGAAHQTHVHYADPVRDRWAPATSPAAPTDLAAGLSAYLKSLHLRAV